MIEYLKLYEIDDKYINDLRENVNPHVFQNTDPQYDYTRKYLGVVLKLNSFAYYAPLSSPKQSDYIVKSDGYKIIRNSILPIIRMVESDVFGSRHLLGTIKLSNMIPVPSQMLTCYDLENEEDLDYKDLVLKEKRFINRNNELITSYAEALYKEKISGTSTKGYINNTFDFRAFELYLLDNYKDI